MIKSKFLILCLFLAASLGLLWQFYPLPDAKNRLNDLPLIGPGFVGNNVPLNDFEEKAFKKVSVIKRIYRVQNENYLVTVVDGTHDRHVVHDPYYCFTGSGWELQSQKNFKFKNGTGEEIVLSRGTRHRAALFWFSDGITTFSSPLEYWWKATLRRLSFGKSGPEPILIMIQPLDSITQVNWEEVMHILKPFVLL